MKRNRTALLLGMFLLGNIVTVFQSKGDDLKLFIFAGQANMIGMGKAGELPEGPVNLRAPQKDVLYAVTDPKAKNELLDENPWTMLQPLKEAFGPEIGFGHTIVRNLPEQHIAIVKVASGNSSLGEQWNPDAKEGPQLYASMIRFVQDAVERRQKAGDTVEIAGFIWYQGEEDAHSEKMAAAYHGNLSRFLARVRTDFKKPELPIVAVRIGIREHNPGKFEPEVRSAIEAVCGSEAHTAWVSVDRLPLVDGEHLGSASELEAGARLAKAWLKLAGHPTSAMASR